MLASEYGWQPESILALPVDVIACQTHAILCRRGIRTIKRVVTKEDEAPSLADRMREIDTSIKTWEQRQ